MTPNEYMEEIGPYVDYYDVQPPTFIFENLLILGRFIYNECHVFAKKEFIMWGRKPNIIYEGDVKCGPFFLNYLHDTLETVRGKCDITEEYNIHEERYMKIKGINE